MANDDRRDRAADVLEVGHHIEEHPSDTVVHTAFAAELEAHRALSKALGRVDLAHVVGLLEAGVIPPEAGADLLRALLALEDDPEAFALDPALGDAYTNREAHIAEHTHHVGWLGAGRARREATTTAYHIVLRQRLLAFDEALSAFGRTLVSKGAEHSSTLFPDYTYLQAGQPTTFGHYLTSFLFPLLRDRERLRETFARVDRSPAGCGSANGSTLPQDRLTLARKLGFPAVVTHARDAMWQADGPIELLNLVCASMVGLDRLAEDLMFFAATDVSLVRLADRHVRASKVMPQKRNPFALAYVRSVANQCMGIQSSITAAGRTPSGQMDNRLGPYRQVPEALDAATGAAKLVAEIVDALEVDVATARAAVEQGYALATDLAEGIVTHAGVDFRTAHRIAAALVRHLAKDGRPLTTLRPEELNAELPPECPHIPEETLATLLSPESALAARNQPGCAAGTAFEAMIEEAAEALSRGDAWASSAKARIDEADRLLFALSRSLAQRGS